MQTEKHQVAAGNEASAKVAVQLKATSTSLLYSSSLPQNSSTTHLWGIQFTLLVLYKLEDFAAGDTEAQLPGTRDHRFLFSYLYLLSQQGRFEI